MNILEAIKSGKRFRRLSSVETGYYCARGDQLELGLCTDYNALFSLEDIIAEDWEVEQAPEKSVTVTRRQLSHAYCVARDREDRPGSTRYSTFEILCQQLGLGEEETK